jgi:uncharacterized protein YqcC (DUF446 family)
MRAASPSYEVVGDRITAIEAEMKRIGWWREEPLPPEMYHFTQAFAMDTMPYAYWLQFIFIPRVHAIIAERGQFPPSSSVGIQAIREFDGQDEAVDLVHLLCEFDALFRAR